MDIVHALSRLQVLLGFSVYRWSIRIIVLDCNAYVYPLFCNPLLYLIIIIIGTCLFIANAEFVFPWPIYQSNVYWVLSWHLLSVNCGFADIDNLINFLLALLKIQLVFRKIIIVY